MYRSVMFIPLSGLLALGLLYLFSLSACNPPQNEPIRVGAIPWAGYETLFLARELDLFPNQLIQLKELSSTTETLRAFRQGQLEVAALTLDETLRLAQTESDLQIILVTNLSNGADKLISRPDIKQIKDLKDKRIAVEENTVSAYMLFQSLQLVGLSLDDIQPVASTLNQHEYLMQTGQVDAVVTFDPTAFRLERAGFHKLVDSSEIHGKIVDVLVTRKSLLKTQPKVFEKLLAGYWEAQAFLLDYPEQAYPIIAPRLSIDSAYLPQIYRQLILPDPLYHQQLMQQDLLGIIEQHNTFMLDHGMLDKPVNAAALLGQDG